MRKKVLDDSKRAAICGILSIGGTKKMAANYVGCSRHTIRNTAMRDPEFRRQLAQTKVSPEITYLKTLYSAGQEKWTAAKWALQHMYPDRYARKPMTMELGDVKDLISQLLAAIVKVIPNSKIRAAVRRNVRVMTRAAIRKTRNQCRGR
ncbi:MAG TPA: hypothetical protein VGJ15_04520 [Pirellulales bacterium]|jgi:hypothetical protein